MFVFFVNNSLVINLI